MAVGESASKADLGDLVSRLRVMAQGRETIDVAQLHFVGLKDIQEAYGERWPDQKAKIQDAAEGFLRRRIDSGDLLIRGEGGFLVVLGAAAGPEAHAVAAQLTHGLNTFFVGENGQSPAPRFGGAVQSMPAKELETSFGDLDVVTSSRPANSSEDFGLPELEWRFEPVWDVRREMLSYWYVTPFLKASGARLPGYQFENVAAHPSQFLKVDEAAMWVAEQALQELLATDRRTLVGSTVHIGTLANLAARARLLATIDRLDPDLHRFRIVKIAGVTPGFPRMYLKEIVGVLKARLANVFISASWDEPDVAGLLQSGPVGAGFVVPTSSVASGPLIAIPTLMGRIADAVKSAHSARARFFVEGGVNKFLALKLAATGVDNIAAQRIWPARPMAEGMLKWPADRLAAA